MKYLRWNPYLNAIGAAAYIWGVVLILNYISSFRHDTPDTLADGASALSLLVFSVAVMGFVFFYHPAVLLLENKRSEAVSFFLKTLGTFGVITLVIIFTIL